MENESIRKWLIGLSVLGALLVGFMGQRWLLPEEHRLVFAAGQRGGLYHELAQHLASELQAAHPRLSIEVIETDGSLDNAKRLQNQEADLALLQNDTQGGAQARSLTAIHPELLHFLCHRDADIQSLHELAGHTVAVGTKGSGSEQFTHELFRYLGLAEKELNLKHLSLAEATRQLVAGEVDALLFLTGLGNAACAQALQSDKVQLAPLVTAPDSDWSHAGTWAETLAEGFRVHYPYVTPHTLPLLAYPGADGKPGHPSRPIPTVGVKAVLTCHRELPEELAENITRTIFEHRAVLSQKHSAFSNLDESQATARLQFPTHAGAELFFRRDEPGFLVKYAEAMGFILSACILLWGLGSGVRKWLLQKRKDRIDKYYQAIEGIIGRLRENEECVDELEKELISLRKDALSELVREKLAADESFMIYQNMANGCQQLLAQKKQERRQAGG